jgi:hypothetical protein
MVATVIQEIRRSYGLTYCYYLIGYYIMAAYIILLYSVFFCKAVIHVLLCHFPPPNAETKYLAANRFGKLRLPLEFLHYRTICIS